MASCPRAVAIEVLCQWQAADSALDVWLEPRLAAMADGRDRNLAKALVFGVLRQRGFIDWALARLSTTPLPRLKPDILQALRLGAYQLLFMERLPAAAAIHATVEAVKRLGQPRWLTGFVNGVLRNLGRRAPELLAAREAGQLPPVAAYNHPDWLITRWRVRYGEEGLLRLCRSNQQVAEHCLRVNSAKVSVADYTAMLNARGIPWRPGRYLPEAVWLSGGGSVADLPGYEAGYFFIQDEIAQLIGGLAQPFPAGNCLDACAGLGGKTAILAGLVPPAFALVAVEPQARRQRLFSDNMTRLGLLDRVSLYRGSLAAFGQDRGPEFSAVLVDAPCSGLGVTGRHPDIRWQRQEADLARYQATQLAILQEAARLLLPGGVLVYATCSLEPEENDEVVTRFREGHPQFVVDSAADSLPAAARELVDANGFVRSLPGQHGSDGFFAARLRRR